MSNKYKRAVCADGYSVSIQAHNGAYCEPRCDDAELYTEVELGYPNRPDDLIIKYAEDPEEPCGTVYPYVPAPIVSLVIAKHGGMVDGELPPGIPYLRADP